MSVRRRRGALLVFMPALGSAVAHAPVLVWDLFPALERPLDGGRTFRGRRVLGDNKTWRGALTMVAGSVAATAALWRWAAYRDRLPPAVRDAGAVRVGALVGAGVVLGELPNSFAKRQLGVAPGKRAPGALGIALAIWDQADFVPAVCLLLRPIWRITAREALGAFAAVMAVHVPVNLIGYAVGARTEPL